MMQSGLLWVYLINITLIIVTVIAYFQHLRAQRRRDQKYRPDPLASRRRKKPPPPADD